MQLMAGGTYRGGRRADHRATADTDVENTFALAQGGPCDEIARAA